MAGSLCPAPMCGGATMRMFGLPALHADADAGGACVEALFCIVCAEHDDEQIDRLMRHERGVYHVEPGHALMQWVAENSSAPGKPLLEHKVILAKRLLQEAGPALVLGEAVGVVGGIFGVCAVAMGVGIAKADNVFFHVRDLLTS